LAWYLGCHPAVALMWLLVAGTACADGMRGR
jgi:hypothetical protein